MVRLTSTSTLLQEIITHSDHPKHRRDGWTSFFFSISETVMINNNHTYNFDFAIETVNKIYTITNSCITKVITKIVEDSFQKFSQGNCYIESW